MDCSLLICQGMLTVILFDRIRLGLVKGPSIESETQENHQASSLQNGTRQLGSIQSRRKSIRNSKKGRGILLGPTALKIEPLVDQDQLEIIRNDFCKEA